MDTKPDVGDRLDATAEPSGAFAVLPDELMVVIFSHLSPIDLSFCSRVSRLFHRLASDRLLWHGILEAYREAYREPISRWISDRLDDERDGTYQDLLAIEAAAAGEPGEDPAGDASLAHADIFRQPEDQPAARDAVAALVTSRKRNWYNSQSEVRRYVARGVQYPHAAAVSHVRILPHDRQVVTAANDNHIRVWDISVTDTAAANLYGHYDDVTCIELMGGSQSRRLVSSSRDHTVRLWSVAEGQTAKLEGHTDWVRRVRPSGTSLVSSGRDGTAIVWDAMSGKAVTTIQHDVAVWDARFSETQRTSVFSVDVDGYLIHTDTRAAEPVTRLRVHRDFVSVLEIDSSTGLIATGSCDGTVVVSDERNLGRPVHTLALHTARVTSMTARYGSLFTTDARTDTFMWDLASGKLKRDFIDSAAKMSLPSTPAVAAESHNAVVSMEGSACDAQHAVDGAMGIVAVTQPNTLVNVFNYRTGYVIYRLDYDRPVDAIDVCGEIMAVGGYRFLTLYTHVDREID